MTRFPTYRLLAIDSLIPHEQVDPEKVTELVEEFRRTGVVEEPIWVDRDTRVILNGHHRWAALKQLGVRKAPVWLVEYQAPSITVDLWTPGPAVTKEEVIARGREGRPFPPKTTRHRFRTSPPPRSTAINRLTSVRLARRPASLEHREKASSRLHSGAPVPSRAGGDSSGGE